MAGLEPGRLLRLPSFKADGTPYSWAGRVVKVRADLPIRCLKETLVADGYTLVYASDNIPSGNRILHPPRVVLLSDGGLWDSATQAAVADLEQPSGLLVASFPSDGTYGPILDGFPRQGGALVSTLKLIGGEMLIVSGRAPKYFTDPDPDSTSYDSVDDFPSGFNGNTNTFNVVLSILDYNSPITDYQDDQRAEEVASYKLYQDRFWRLGRAFRCENGPFAHGSASFVGDGDPTDWGDGLNDAIAWAATKGAPGPWTQNVDNPTEYDQDPSTSADVDAADTRWGIIESNTTLLGSDARAYWVERDAPTLAQMIRDFYGG